MTYEVDSNGEAINSNANKAILTNAGWAYFANGPTNPGWAKGPMLPKFTIGSALQIAASDAYYASRA